MSHVWMSRHLIAGIIQIAAVNELTTDFKSLNDRNMSCYKLKVVIHFLKYLRILLYTRQF